MCSVHRVLSAYADDLPFSVNLVGSVVRLSTFAEKMYDLHWTEPEHFTENAEDELILAHAISRYHSWVALLIVSEKIMVLSPITGFWT